MKQPQRLTLDADAAFNARRYMLAETCAHAAVTLEPTNAAAWTVRAKVALAYNRPDLARRWLEAALKAGAYFKPATKLLASLPPPESPLAIPGASTDAGGAHPPRHAHPKYLFIREWGCGFWSDVDHVLGAILAAEYTGRAPVVHWGCQSNFAAPDAPVAGAASDSWEHYFEPVSAATFEQAAAAARAASASAPPASPGVRNPGAFPAPWRAMGLDWPITRRWSGGGVGTGESRVSALAAFTTDAPVFVSDFHTSFATVLSWAPAWHPLHGVPFEQAYRRMVKAHLRIRPAHTRRADEFFAAKLAGAPTLAVHLRGLDKVAEHPDLELTTEAIRQAVFSRMSTTRDLRLFLMTDWSPAAEHFAAAFPGRVAMTDALRDEAGTGIHRRGLNGRRLGEEVLTDSLIAARCDAFLGTGPSTVSCLIEFLKDWPAGACALHGNYQLAQFNTAIYTMDDPPAPVIPPEVWRHFEVASPNA